MVQKEKLSLKIIIILTFFNIIVITLKNKFFSSDISYNINDGQQKTINEFMKIRLVL